MKRERPVKSGALFASLRGHKENQAERFRPIYHLIHLTKAKGCVILASKLRRAVRRADKMKRKAGTDMKRRSWKRWLSALFAGVLLLSLLSGCSVKWGDVDGVLGPGDSSASSDYVSEVVRLVNIERTERGLPALTMDTRLNAAAAERAEEIITHFAHERPDGSSWFTILSEYGISYRAAAENIAGGQPTPSAVVNSWMNSSGHRANILDGSLRKIGVGYARGGQYGTYWVQLFTG